MKQSTTTRRRELPSPFAPFVILATAITLTAPGCSSQQAKASPASGAAQASRALVAPPALRAIPFDTPYALVSLSRPPTAHVDMALAVASQHFAEVENQASALRQKGQLQPEERIVVALADELAGKLSRQGLESLGFHSQPRAAVYGIGVMPAMRLEIKDGRAIEAFIERILAKAATPMVKRATIGSQTYWYLDSPDGRMTAMAAVVGQELVAGVTPTGDKERFASVLFGAPQKSMAATQALQQMIATHGLGRQALAYVDFQNATSILFGERSGFLPDELKHAMASLSPICKTEIRGLASSVPRLAMGIEHSPGRELAAAVAVEMAPARARELAGLKTQVQGFGLQPDSRDLFSVGIGLDVQKMLSYIESRASAVQSAPFGCDKLAGLNEAAGEILANLSRSSAQIPAIARQPRGVHVAIRNGNFTTEPPSDISGTAILAMADPMQLVTLGRSLVPQLGELNVSPGGQPAPLPEMGPIRGAHMAVSDSSVGVSMGQGMERDLAALLAAPPKGPAPMARVAIDASRIAGLLQAHEPRAAAMLSSYRRGELTLDIGERGVVLRVHGHMQ